MLKYGTVENILLSKWRIKMGIFDVFVAVIWGIVEGITEWLPVSSTGHMILVEEFLKFQDEQFSQMFLVVVQLGAILAVVLLFCSRIWPFRFTKDRKSTRLNSSHNNQSRMPSSA